MTRSIRPAIQYTERCSQHSAMRPYAKGLASGVMLMGLIGCLPDAPSAPITAAVAHPKDVRVALPRASEVGRAEVDTPDTDPVEHRATLEDVSAWMANGAAEAPAKLRELNEKARKANEELARREAATTPTTSAPPAAAPTTVAMTPPPPQPAREPAPVTPPVSAPAAVKAATVPPASPTPSPTTSPTSGPPAPSAEIAGAADVLANAMSAAIARNASADDLTRPIAKAAAEAIAAISDPNRPFDICKYPSLDEDEAAFVTRLHEASAEVGRDLAAGKPIGEAVAKLAEAIKAVEPAKPLLVKRSEFATKVDGFGQLQPIANRRFLPGRQNQIILYNELDGFTSDRNDKNEWVTNLATKIQILAKHDGTEVWNRNWVAVTDTSSVRRGDFFVCEKVVLSEYLTVGTYILKTSVRDERTGAIAEKSVEFSMVADPSLAAR